jgi:tRNA (guanine37-N1)-methyltransferase
MEIDILSLFPSYFTGPFDVSILRRAIEAGLIQIRHTDIRSFSKDKHKKVDERPFGGGPGMILAPQPTVDALRSVKKEGSHVIYMNPQGNLLTAKRCQELSEKKHIIILCGHYEGIDERIVEKEVDEEISVGDYVLTNGCLPAIVLVDAVSRFIPGVLGHPDAAIDESFQNYLLDGPQYTRPEEFEGIKVPKILLSGNHAKIAEWKNKMRLKKTKLVRKDLYKKYLHEKRQLQKQGETKP